METIRALSSDQLTTHLGEVGISAASHVDGSISVVAWMADSGRRVGYLSQSAANAVPAEPQIDPAVAMTHLATRMLWVRDQAVQAAMTPLPIGERMVRAGLLSESERSDLLGWQWLLDELGEHHMLGELATQAGRSSIGPVLALAGSR